MTFFFFLMKCTSFFLWTCLSNFDVYFSQEKNVSKDLIQGKIGRIYIPDQKVCAHLPLFLYICFLVRESWLSQSCWLNSSLAMFYHQSSNFIISPWYKFVTHSNNLIYSILTHRLERWLYPTNRREWRENVVKQKWKIEMMGQPLKNRRKILKNQRGFGIVQLV